MIASKRNMEANYDTGVFAYSPDTGEECSANPGDYWYMSNGDILEDGNGNAMILARRREWLEKL